MTNDDIKKEDVLDEENLEKDETEEIENEEGSEEVKEEASDEDEKYKNLMDKFMRLQADFSNYKRRTETQKSAFVELGVKKIVNDLLPVIDNFERAMDSIGDKDSTYDGIRIIKDQLTYVLKNEGIV